MKLELDNSDNSESPSPGRWARVFPSAVAVPSSAERTQKSKTSPSTGSVDDQQKPAAADQQLLFRAQEIFGLGEGENRGFPGDRGEGSEGATGRGSENEVAAEPMIFGGQILWQTPAYASQTTTNAANAKAPSWRPYYGGWAYFLSADLAGAIAGVDMGVPAESAEPEVEGGVDHVGDGNDADADARDAKDAKVDAHEGRRSGVGGELGFTDQQKLLRIQTSSGDANARASATAKTQQKNLKGKSALQ